MTRRGWTLHEMLISLTVMSGVMALAAHFASAQLRFYRNAGELAALRTQTGQASTIAASAFWSVSPADGDLSVALDSAVEVHLAIGTAVVCASAPGRVTIPASANVGNTLASFVVQPDSGDRIAALFEDSVGATWLTFYAAEPASTAGDCPYFPEVAGTRTVVLQEPVTLPIGAALRFTRPMRLSLYRGTDNRWYLGAKDWNVDFQRFNSVQPVAGPLRPYSEDAARTGLRFLYRDASGVELAPPIEPTRVASVTVITRAASTRFDDSTAVAVGLRNAR